LNQPGIYFEEILNTVRHQIPEEAVLKDDKEKKNNQSIFLKDSFPRIMSSKSIGGLERQIVRVESILILLSIGAIASGDYLFGPQISLGYLYLIPLSYSALTHRWFVTASIVLICVVLRQWFGPLDYSSWGLIARDWILTAIFLSVVTALYRLGRSRHEFFETARFQRDELVRELKLAANVQSQLLKRHQPPDGRFEIVAKTYPAKVVGGDYYDFISMGGEDHSGIVIADVAGKGLPAALLMPAVQIALRTLASRYRDANRIIRELNSVFYEATEHASYATLFLGILNLKTGAMEYVNAGHQPPLILRHNHEKFEELTDGGPPVGLLPDADYVAGKIMLNSGDILTLYTDGIVEAENETGEFYENHRLEQVIRNCRNLSPLETIEKLREGVEGFCGGNPPNDDLTAIVVRESPDTASKTV
jgi:serine phosphatase RsbU (regulator of sigma subunit)